MDTSFPLRVIVVVCDFRGYSRPTEWKHHRDEKARTQSTGCIESCFLNFTSIQCHLSSDKRCGATQTAMPPLPHGWVPVWAVNVEIVGSVSDLPEAGTGEEETHSGRGNL